MCVWVGEECDCGLCVCGWVKSVTVGCVCVENQMGKAMYTCTVCNLVHMYMYL